MNKLMGPEGALSQPQRANYLASNLPEHDKLLGSIGNVKASGIMDQGMKMLNNVPSKGYFNNAGIAGGVNQSPYAQKNDQMMEDNHDEDEFWY